MNAFISHSSYSQPAANTGFTLIELLVTIAVLAIITSIAAPSISTQLANQRVKSTTATLANALKEAKVESVIRRQIVDVAYQNTSSQITIKDAKNYTIATYKYDPKITITGNASVKFKPNKTADNTTYTICDNNTSASPRQISVNKLGNITTQIGGSCS